MMNPIAVFIYNVLQVYMFVLIIQVVMSWLIAFNIVNTRNRFVFLVADVSYKLTEPALRPIRRYLPNLGGIDVSPIVLILLIGLVQNLVLKYVNF
jgi:YggT family protein